MPLKNYYHMKVLLTISFAIILILLCQDTKGQNNKTQQTLIKEIQFYLTIPNSLECDSCYSLCTLLRVEFDEKTQLSVLEVADNSDLWLKKDIIRVKEKFNIKKIDSIAVLEEYKNTSFLFPLIIQSAYFPCPNFTNYPKLEQQQSFFLFNGKRLDGTFIFGEKIFYKFTRRKSCDASSPSFKALKPRENE